MCGADTGVAPDDKPPFKFTGTIYSVSVDVSGELIQDAETKMKANVLEGASRCRLEDRFISSISARDWRGLPSNLSAGGLSAYR